MTRTASRAQEGSGRPVALQVNIIPSPAGDGGLTLATATLRAEPDVVSLCRRVRQAAQDFALEPSEVGRLSVAVFEVGRWLAA